METYIIIGLLVAIIVLLIMQNYESGIKHRVLVTLINRMNGID